MLAANDVGEGPLSSAFAIKAGMQPEAPALPTLVSQMPNEIVFSWVEPANNFDAIFDYKVYWDVGRGDTLFDLLTPSTFG